MTRIIPIVEIQATSATQIRKTLDTRVIDDYAGKMAEGVEFPPLTVFFDGNRYILADGFHRIAAAKQAGIESFQCDVHEGGLRDALEYALGANDDHGLRRSNKDKRHAVEMALKDPEWSKKSNSDIARLCKVSIPMARNVRHQMAEADEIELPDKITVTRDGKEVERAAQNRTRRTQSEVDRDEFFAFALPPYDGFEAHSRWGGGDVDKVKFLMEWCKEYLMAAENHDIMEMMP